MIGLNIPSPALPCSPCVEIGWRLAKPYWGQGLAAEGAVRALGVGFQQLGLPEIIAFTAVSNMPSQALMQRLGMLREPETFLHPGLSPDHVLARHCLYRIRNNGI